MNERKNSKKIGLKEKNCTEKKPIHLKEKKYRKKKLKNLEAWS
jgi:hypothetical protein